MLHIGNKLISKVDDLSNCIVIELQRGCVICRTDTGKEVAFYYHDIYNFFEVLL